MRIHNYILVLSLIALSIPFLAGCTNNDNTGTLDLRFSRLPESITAPVGATRVIEFRVWASDKQGYAAGNIRIQLQVTSGPGSIEPIEDVTGPDGKLVGAYTVDIGSASGMAVITANAETGNRISQNILIEPTAAPANIALSATPSVVFVPLDETVSIDLAARITDAVGSGLSGLTPLVTLEATNISDTAFGELSNVPPTDAVGITEFQFTSRGEYGNLTIKCEIDSMDGGNENTVAFTTISVLPLERRVAELTMTIEPDTLFLTADSQGRSDIEVSLIDFTGNPLPEVTVVLTSNYGLLADTILTDTAGIARSPFFIQPRRDFPDEVDVLNAVVTASIPNTEKTISQIVIVTKVPDRLPVLTVSADRYTIYADNGQTVANVAAWLRNADGQDMTNYSINFTSEFGTITPQAFTDGGGVARAVFRDLGEPSLDSLGNVVPVTIKARYGPAGVSAQLGIAILPYAPITKIQLGSNTDNIPVVSPDTVILSALCLRANDMPAPESTLVRFEVDKGFLIDAAGYTDGSGRTTARYKVGQVAGQAGVTAWTTTFDERTDSDTLYLTILPDVAHHILASSEPDTLQVAQNGRSTISATVYDQYDNHLNEDILITFTSDIGDMLTSEALTDATGTAAVEFRANTVAGRAMITAETQTGITGSTFVEILAGDPVGIEASSEAEFLRTLGATEIYAKVVDDLGNPVNGQFVVWVEIVGGREPGGSNRGWINETNVADTTTVFDGQAEMLYRAGGATGGIWIRTGCWLDEDSTQVALDSTLIIVSP